METQLQSFIEQIQLTVNSNKRVAIIADNDLDGIISSVKLDTGLFDWNGIEVEPFFREEKTGDLPWMAIQEYNPDILFFLDIAVNSVPDINRLIRKPRRGFIIDHHVVTEEVTIPRTHFYNPCSDGRLYLPTVYLVDQVISTLTGDDLFQNTPELTFLGIFADAGIGFEDNTFIIEKGLDPAFTWAKQNNPKLLDILEFDGFRIPRGHHLCIVLNQFLRKKGIDELSIQLVNRLSDDKPIMEFIEKIEQTYRLFAVELYAEAQSIINRDWEKTQPILIHNHTEFFGNGELARLVVERTQIPTIIYTDTKMANQTTYSISGRAPRRDHQDINLVPLFSKYGGGGHPKACGLRVSKLDMDDFLKDVKTLLKYKKRK